MEEANNGVIQFKWGKKRGVGGAKKDVQFYESFIFDEVNYNLYDCVYLFKDGQDLPYIAKIVKIWEQGDGKKKVKLLWFFHPCEVITHLRGHKVLENEIFLACGEGVGLTNINPLEAIAGKCSVICTSEDARNLKASKDALERADYIFYRTFDVGALEISDSFPDKIAGVEVSSLLNREEDQAVILSLKPEANGFDTEVKPDVSTASQTQENKVKTEEPGHTPPISVPSKDAINVKHQNDTKQLSGVRDALESGNSVAHHVGEKNNRKHNAQPDDLHRSENAKRVCVRPDKGDSGESANQLNEEIAERTKLSEKKLKSTDESLQKVPGAVPTKNNAEAENQVLEVSRKPDADRSKWFKGMTWERRIQKAQEQGTLMFLQNFDRTLTSADIEEIMHHFCNQTVTAKVISAFPPYHNPYYGQAYVIFRTSAAADETIHKINTGCLMLKNGSAFMASKGMVKSPPKPTKLLGHLSINKIKMVQREEMRKAVSTSHCSQPNTIEYEMAMDWSLLQERTVSWFSQLHKRHRDEAKKVMKSSKSDK